MQTHLRDSPVTLRRLDHFSPFAHTKGQGLFHVDILSGLKGVDGLERMPVVGRADDHRIDILAVEHPAVVGELRWVPARFRGRKIHVGPGEVANGYRLCILMSQESVEHLVSPVSDADKAETNPLVRPSYSHPVERCRRAGCDEGLPKISSVDSFHEDFLSLCFLPV